MCRNPTTDLVPRLHQLDSKSVSNRPSHSILHLRRARTRTESSDSGRSANARPKRSCNSSNSRNSSHSNRKNSNSSNTPRLHLLVHQMLTYTQTTAAQVGRLSTRSRQRLRLLTLQLHHLQLRQTLHSMFSNLPRRHSQISKRTGLRGHSGSK